MPLRIGPDLVKHVYIGEELIKKIYVGASEIFQNVAGPVISAFSVSPQTIDLDSRATGNIQFVFTVNRVTSGSPVPDTMARIRGPGGNVSNLYVGTAGAALSETLPNIPQPNETTDYLLDVWNTGGRSQRIARVTVTQNPALSMLAATGFGGGQGAPLGETIQISGRVRGYPRPAVSIDNGWGTLSDRHFSKIAGQVNLWSFSDRRFFGTGGRRPFRVRATNSSGTVSQDVVFNG